jgi:hypothetical protein
VPRTALKQVAISLGVRFFTSLLSSPIHDVKQTAAMQHATEKIFNAFIFLLIVFVL